MPIVTVILPAYNSGQFLEEAVKSIQAQTLKDWEMFIISEYGSADATKDLAQRLQGADRRIYLIQNIERLGLSESLNIGIRRARGKYIARMDADDLAHPARFEKQVRYLEEHPGIAVCGTWQHHFGPDTDWVHKGAVTVEQCRANLLFFCDLCHSTLMLRTEVFRSNGLLYDSQYLAEDFELWTRVLLYGDIVNLPEILGEYRCGNGNITLAKKNLLHIESGRIVSNSLMRNLKLRLTEKETECMQNWHNPIEDADDKELFLHQLESVLRKIYFANEKENFYSRQALLNAIFTKWRWIKFHEPFTSLKPAGAIDAVFQYKPKWQLFMRLYYFLKYNRGLRNRLRKLCRRLKQTNT